jgi:class 3 adenylate cyclase
VFTPHPQVREVPSRHYCVGGPGTTPHIVAQRALAPGEAWEASLRLAEGRYRVRFTGERTWRWLDVANGADMATLRVSDGGIDGDDARVGPAFALRVENGSGRPVVAVVESVEWARDALSAGELVADQRFRDLFSKEVLAPGVRLAVEDVTVLFTDVVGSTALYNTLGDARAFRLVQDHFGVLRDVVARHRGAIVKTIGDAILAVFAAPADALAGAAALHAEVGPAVRERGHPAGVTLRVGVHGGPAIAVTLNERLDYFGTTVNLAARAEHLAGPGEIVTTEDLARRAGDALRERGWRSAGEEATPKGFSSPVRILRWSR